MVYLLNRIFLPIKRNVINVKTQMNFKIIMQNERSQRKWYRYEYVELAKKKKSMNCKLIYSEEKNISGCLEMGRGGKRRAGWGIARRWEKNFSTDMFIILNMVMISCMNTYSKFIKLYTLNMCHLLNLNYNLKESY